MKIRVKLLACLVLLFTANSAISQISVFYDVTKNKFTEKNDYHQEGSDLWVGVGVNGLVLYETNLIDTAKLFSSFGCAQYQLSDTIYTIYLWLDYYYSSDCLCTENDNSCTPDTTNYPSILFRLVFYWKILRFDDFGDASRRLYEDMYILRTPHR